MTWYHRHMTKVAPAPKSRAEVLPESPFGGSRARRSRSAAKDAPRVLRLQELFGLTQAEVAELLEVSPSTLARRPLNSRELDRLAVLEGIGRLAVELLPRVAVSRWLAEPKRALDGRPPKELLATENGRRVVETFLLRALDGTVG